jgi:hypothetical protein
MGDVYALVNKAKTKCPQSRLVLSGVLRHRDILWQQIGALNKKYNWIVNTLGIPLLDLNSRIQNCDFSRDGLHIN